MKCKDIMAKNIKSCTRDCTAIDAAKLMKEINSGVIPIVNEENQILGVLTDRDITLKTIAEFKDPFYTSVQDIMSQSVVTVSPNESIDSAISKMKEYRVRRLPVVDNNKVVLGMLSLGDIAVQAHEEHETFEALEKISEPISRW